MSEQDTADESEPRSFGPMHGELVPRHQFVIPPDFRKEVIVSTYVNTSATVGPTLSVELYAPHLGVVAADLTVERARNLRDYLTEFVDAYGDHAGTLTP